MGSAALSTLAVIFLFRAPFRGSLPVLGAVSAVFALVALAQGALMFPSKVAWPPRPIPAAGAADRLAVVLLV